MSCQTYYELSFPFSRLDRNEDRVERCRFASHMLSPWLTDQIKVTTSIVYSQYISYYTSDERNHLLIVTRRARYPVYPSIKIRV